jgi:hypothetical protein
MPTRPGTAVRGNLQSAHELSAATAPGDTASRAPDDSGRLEDLRKSDIAGAVTKTW